MPSACEPIHVFGLGLPVLEDGASVPLFRRLSHPAIDAAGVLVGGRAELAPYADHPAEKLPAGKNTNALYAAIQANSAAGRRQAVLCSGDPLFFGLGACLVARLGREALRIYPGTSSLQAAAALAGLPWESVRAVSLHGRGDWLPLAHALLGATPVFVLTDAKSDPAGIASWMLERGLRRFSLRVLENMYRMPDGAIRAASDMRLSLPQARAWTPELRGNNEKDGGIRRVILILPEASLPSPTAARPWPFGLADAEVIKENALLTKSPIRAAALAALGIEPRHTVWDLGAGSGAVSLEAARLAWQGRVYAVERNPDRVAAIRENRRRYGAANLEIVEGEMPVCLPASAGDSFSPTIACCDGPCPPAPAGENAGGAATAVAPGVVLPCPERVFIGGGLGGNLASARETLARVWEVLAPGGRLIAACVLLSSLELARAELFRLGAKISVSSLQACIGSPLANDMRLEAMNPVFLVLAEKSGAGRPPAERDA